MTNKIATVLVLDLFPFNNEKCALENIYGLESMVHWCRDFIIQKQIFSPFDEIGLVLCSPKSENDVSDLSAVEACYNLQTPQSDLLAGISILEARVQAVRNSSTSGSGITSTACSTLLQGLEAAVKVLLSNKKTYAGKQIIALLPDCGKAQQSRKDLIIGLLDKLSQESISLLVLGLDDEGVIEDAKQETENVVVFRTLCEELTRRAEVKNQEEDGGRGTAMSLKTSPVFSSSAIIGWDEAQKAVNALRPRKGMVRPLCKVVWTIGGPCKIATQLYTRSSVQTIPTLKKVVRRTSVKSSSIGPGFRSTTTSGKMGKKRERSEQVVESSSGMVSKDNDEEEWSEVVSKTEYYPVDSFVRGTEDISNPAASSTKTSAVPADQLLTAYRYGSTWIPCSDADLFAMKMHEPVRSLATLGFVPEEQVAPFINAGGSGAKALLPLADDEMGQRGFRAMTAAMAAEKTVAIVRYVRSANQNPKLALLSIPLEASFHEQEGARFLVMTTLPFQEDVRMFQFPSYGIQDATSTSISSPSPAAEDLLGKLVDTMTLESRSAPTESGISTPSWSTFPSSPSLYNPTWQHFYHVVHFKLEDGALRQALSVVDQKRRGRSHEEANTVVYTMLRVIQNCESTNHGNKAKTGEDDEHEYLSMLEASITNVLQSRPSAEKVAVELDTRVATTSTGFHQLQSQTPHELLPLFLKAAPLIEDLSKAFPLLSFTAAQEEAVAAESVAAARRHRHEQVDGNQGGLLPTSWFSLGNSASEAVQNTENTSTTGLGVAAPASNEQAAPIHNDASSLPIIQKVSTIDPAGTFEILIDNLLTKKQMNGNTPAEISPRTTTDEGRLFSIFMELENVIRELFRHSFPDTHYCKIRDAVMALRRCCCQAQNQYLSARDAEDKTGSQTTAPLSSFSDYYNDYLKKLLLWCRAEGHDSWFTQVGLLSAEAAKGERGSTTQSQLEQWILVSTELSKTHADDGKIGPITAAECANSPLSDDRAGLLYLLESRVMAETLPGEDEDDELLNNEGQDDVDDWIE